MENGVIYKKNKYIFSHMEPAGSIDLIQGFSMHKGGGGKCQNTAYL
jgi:hypothetical protein